MGNENQEIKWSYQAEDSKSDDAKPKESTFSWSASEYIAHDKGFSWYLAFAIGSVLLSAVLYFVTRDYMTPVLVASLGIIIGAFAIRKPQTVAYELTLAGIVVGGKNHPYSDFKSFSVIREGAIDSIMLTPLRRFSIPVSAYFEPQDEAKITQILAQYLPLEQNKLDGIERLSRTLRF